MPSVSFSRKFFPPPQRAPSARDSLPFCLYWMLGFLALDFLPEKTLPFGFPYAPVPIIHPLLLPISYLYSQMRSRECSTGIRSSSLLIQRATTPPQGGSAACSRIVRKLSYLCEPLFFFSLSPSQDRSRSRSNPLLLRHVASPSCSFSQNPRAAILSGLSFYPLSLPVLLAYRGKPSLSHFPSFRSHVPLSFYFPWAVPLPLGSPPSGRDLSLFSFPLEASWVPSVSSSLTLSTCDRPKSPTDCRSG